MSDSLITPAVPVWADKRRPDMEALQEDATFYFHAIFLGNMDFQQGCLEISNPGPELFEFPSSEVLRSEGTHLRCPLPVFVQILGVCSGAVSDAEIGPHESAEKNARTSFSAFMLSLATFCSLPFERS